MLALLRSTALVSFLIVYSYPTVTLANRTVKGTITDKNGNGAADLRVKALDNDPWPNPDDLMGTDITNPQGYYEIHYEGGHWDSAPHWWTIWRPDIFIRVSAPVNGWCEDGNWDPGRNWVHRKDSGVTSNHPHRNDLIKNLQLTNYPFTSPLVQTFEDCSNMWCHFNFFFHLSCLACADGGSKIEWSEWVSSRPVIRTRCWWPPKPQCTDEDYAYIRKQCQNAILDVATGVALIAHYANSVEDDLDRALAKELTSLLKKADEYYRQKRTGEARQTMNMLISTIEVEHGKGRLSSTAADALTRQARIVISNRE